MKICRKCQAQYIDYKGDTCLKCDTKLESDNQVSSLDIPKKEDTVRRSLGVTIFAWLNIISGGFGIFAFIVSLIYPFLMGGKQVAGMLGRVLLAGIISLILAILYILVGLNLLKLKEWARKAEIGLAFVRIIQAVLPILISLVIDRRVAASFLSQLTYAGISFLRSSFIPIITIIFFNLPEVKKQFK